MLSFMGKKIGTDFIYNKNYSYTVISIIYIYNCYIFNSYVSSNDYFFVLSYFLNNMSYKDNDYFLKTIKPGYYDFQKFNLNDRIPLNVFYINQKVNIRGITIGKGFSGVIKKHNFRSGDATHGNSRSHNKAGSIGMCQDPGKVYRGKKMAGRLGGKKVFLKNLKILRIDFFYNIIYLKGVVPGFKNSNILISF